MLVKRIITALIGIPFAAYVVHVGGWLYALTVVLLAIVAWHEYRNMLKKNEIVIAYATGLFSIIIISGCAVLGNSRELLLVLMALTFIVLVKAVMFSQSFRIIDAAFTLMGILYIGFSFAHFLMLRNIDMSITVTTYWGSIAWGTVYILLVFIGTWASDTFAYFIGYFFGKNKLCAISPNKTYEGAIGGFIGCIVSIVLFGSLFAIPLYHKIIIGIIIGISAPFGDLAESAIKRYAEIKDSGNFFPGHGGVLDRFDSLMFAVPAVYYYIVMFFPIMK